MKISLRSWQAFSLIRARLILAEILETQNPPPWTAKGGETNYVKTFLIKNTL